MKRMSRITAILGGLVLTVGLGVATAVPASALTYRQDVSYEGNLDTLATCGAVQAGDVVGFLSLDQPCGITDFGWDFQLVGGSGASKYYYVHPGGYDNLCMTASTSQFGVIKLENCVGADQQYWFNPNNSAGYYHFYNDYWGAYLYETSNLINGGQEDAAGLTTSCSYGNNSCTYEQYA